MSDTIDRGIHPAGKRPPPVPWPPPFSLKNLSNEILITGLSNFKNPILSIGILLKPEMSLTQIGFFVWLEIDHYRHLLLAQPLHTYKLIETPIGITP